MIIQEEKVEIVEDEKPKAFKKQHLMKFKNKKKSQTTFNN